MCITAPKFDMDDVWSIKKNVSANGGLLNSTDGLNLKANSTYYSRYGGIKGRCRTRWHLLEHLFKVRRGGKCIFL